MELVGQLESATGAQLYISIAKTCTLTDKSRLTLLRKGSYVADHTGPRSRLRVFDGPALAAFAAKPQHRLFLAELLASYARLASGAVWWRGEGGWQRWDELDLPRLAALRKALPADEQPGVWRRIGDGALFLADVCPEYAERSLGLVEIARLQRATGLRLSTAEGPIQNCSKNWRAVPTSGSVAAYRAPSSSRRGRPDECSRSSQTVTCSRSPPTSWL